MPHPHEQKLHDVVNSLTSESFMSFVAARTAETSSSPSSARPAPPAKVSFRRSLRVTVLMGCLQFELLRPTQTARQDIPAVAIPSSSVGDRPCGCGATLRRCASVMSGRPESKSKADVLVFEAGRPEARSDDLVTEEPLEVR